ncbi:hypothetical protein [Streptomyces sp. NPDC101149]|uniref:hypothetical protein n=1 Tax=Streptomyces sp. NPDC101149 TaxID=3366113 RepID=UPI0037F44281
MNADSSGRDTRLQHAGTLAQTVGAVLAYTTQAEDPEDAAEIGAITDAMVRLFLGAPLRSDGQLTIKSLAEEAGLKRNKLTHKHTNLKDLFYGLVKSQQEPPKGLSDGERAKAAKVAADLQRVREERDSLQATVQQLVRVVHVLEAESERLAEANALLEKKLAAHTGVTELSGRRRRPRT